MYTVQDLLEEMQLKDAEVEVAVEHVEGDNVVVVKQAISQIRFEDDAYILELE